jgi:hypothetical protein
MPADEKGSDKSGQKPEASAVIEEAIEAMRQDPMAYSAADAIEKACRGRKFNVDAAVKEVKPPKPAIEENS